MTRVRWLLVLVLLLGCDQPLIAPSSVRTPSSEAPRSCRGDGRYACPDTTPTPPPPDTVTPPPPTDTVPPPVLDSTGTPWIMDSTWVHPMHAKLEVGWTMEYWMIGWFDGQPWACADDGEKFVGRILVNDNGLRGMREQLFTLESPPPPPEPRQEIVDMGGGIVMAVSAFVADLSVCELHVEIDDPEVAEWIPRTFLGAIGAWLRQALL